MFCEYRHIFGKENTGLHSVRIFNLAVFDILMTLVIGVLISYYYSLNLYIVWFSLFLLGIFFHRLFCVNTTINVSIFGSI